MVGISTQAHQEAGEALKAWQQQIRDLEELAPGIVADYTQGVCQLRATKLYVGPPLDGDNLFRVYDSEGLRPSEAEARTAEDWCRFLGLVAAKDWWGIRLEMDVRGYFKDDGAWPGGVTLIKECPRNYCIAVAKLIGHKNPERTVDLWEKASRGVVSAEDVDALYA